MALGSHQSSHSIPSASRIWERVEAIASRPAQHLDRHPLAGRLRPAGVLVPFYRLDEHPHLLFTKRSEHLPTHKGEISFPGGGRKEGDRSLTETALRETHEELGIRTEDVRIIGAFDDVWSIAGFRVTPVVAEVPPPPVPQVNAHEVDEVIEVDVLRLMDEKIHRTTRMSRLGQLFDVHFYDYGRHVIWGMTGIIVHRLIGWLREAAQ